MSELATPALTTWNIDAVHSVVEFKVKHMMISNVKGQFTGVSGVLSFDENDVTNSRIEATIDVNTINTLDPQRDAHLKTAEFFDAEKFPSMTFKSTRVTRVAAGELSVEGDLTLHGATKKATFAVEGLSPAGKDPWGNTRVGLAAITKINRKDYGLVWNATLETGGILVGEDITISLDIQFVKA
jgi:polyisoprenoid-binding protein YceI